jgi:DNA polymerase-4
MHQREVLHVDVNSAFLSWHYAYHQQIGLEENLLDIPCVIGGNEKKRHGIVLAKSIPAKKMGIKTGQSLMEARLKYPQIKIIPPRYDIYVKASRKMRELLSEYSPKVEAFSIDECFMDMTGTKKIHGDIVECAYRIKDRIKNEFGYTVNIGVSENKLLAKQASELEKPDKVHTLYKEELKEKLWPLEVSELFMVGKRTAFKLNSIGIKTIKDLAETDRTFLSALLKSHGRLIHDYAWGKDSSDFFGRKVMPFKGVGNGSTIPFDVADKETAQKILLSLVETAAKRLRDEGLSCRVVAVGIKDNQFKYLSHQKKLSYFTDCTQDLFKVVKLVFDEAWTGGEIRHLNVRFTDLERSERLQISMFQEVYSRKMSMLDKSIDQIRGKYGDKTIIRGTYIDSGLAPLLGGYPEDDYPDMKSIL